MGDLYGVLGVPRNATFDEVRSAYRTRARSAHPDAGADPADFARLHDAYVVLSDPAERMRYDATLPREPELRPAPTVGRALAVRPRPQGPPPTSLWRRMLAREAYVAAPRPRPLFVDVLAY